ncbi:uncharacterized protein UV8b_07043 [Ustilaginoidea virens]|uniref:Uncharacterized protein n=1 Tax=Ustilaginoidea virens TaxID=1159556 RepID=A0A8E5MK58_USTVR|nr:uncharacterized protein UV8b_07043 [Ustilaginoidea virens]QUC22802.1 hypothetical protein UV8b_07043 [Ustilaginoidea virens]
MTAVLYFCRYATRCPVPGSRFRVPCLSLARPSTASNQHGSVVCLARKARGRVPKDEARPAKTTRLSRSIEQDLAPASSLVPSGCLSILQADVRPAWCPVGAPRPST